MVLIIYISYEIFVFLGINELNFLFNYFIAYTIHYGIIYILGMISKKIDYKTDRKISFTFFIIYLISLIVICSLNQGFQSTQIMKYPPIIYYISFALFMSFLLFSLFKEFNFKNNRFIEFISKSSLWIYLWHILFLNGFSAVFGQINWVIYYLMILICSIGIAYVQNLIIDILESKNINKNILMLFRG